MALPELKLKAGREKALRARHPWIFSGAFAALEAEPGSFARVLDAQGSFLALAMINPGNSLAGRVLSFEDVAPETALAEHVRKASAFRKQLFPSAEVNAFRLINAEADQLPGLIVDSYDGNLVMQIGTLAMHKMRDVIAQALIGHAAPRSILERSESAARAEEGLQDERRNWHGNAPEEVDVTEYGLRYRVALQSGQKTGMFLDQREMRRRVGQVARTMGLRSLLNCFSYQGGFSLHAVQGGCARVTSVEISADALQQTRVNIALNNQSESAHELVKVDAFDYLRDSESGFDAIILDPPAFVKRRDGVVAGCRGYKEINRQALMKLSPGGLLWTFSCSHFVDEKLFRQVLFQAAAEAGRSVQILENMLHGADHPVSIFHPEGSYLKGYLLRVG